MSLFNLSDSCKKDIAEMLASGWSVLEVAEHLGTTVQAVYRLRREDEALARDEEDICRR